jgi:serine protease AprX
MSGITSGNLRDAPGNTKQLRRPQVGNTDDKTKKNGDDNEQKDTVVLRSFLECDEKDILTNLNSNGTIDVIIGAEDSDKLEQLKETVRDDSGSKIKDDLHIINSFSAEIDPYNTNVISLLGDETNISLDEKVSLIKPYEEIPVGDVQIKLDVANEAMNVDKLWDMGLKGKGTTIAVIDTGIHPHKDFGNRIIGFKDFVKGKDGAGNAYDDNKHGTHCASIAAGDGKLSGGKFTGVAPEANLVGIKALDSAGNGSFSDIIKGVQWAVDNKEKYGINVVTMSLGGRATKAPQNDPIVQAVEKAVDKGITMIVAAGNEGPNQKTIGTPAQSPKALTIGALDDKGTVDKDDDAVARFSSRGPTKFDEKIKPDVIAPGVKITAAGNKDGYITLSGTSMSAPHAAGMAALLIQGAPNAKPDKLKDAIMQTADKLKDTRFGEYDQGKGAIDVLGALKKLK